jgi:hypothetical protein
MYIGNDIYFNIFISLEDEDLENLKYTNKFFYKLINYFERRYKKYFFDGTLKSLTSFGQYTNDYGNVHYDKLPIGFLIYAPNAKHLTFYECEDSINFLYIPKFLETLTIVSTPFCDFDTRQFPHIKSIKIERSHNKEKMGKIINTREDIEIIDSY